MAVPIGGTLSPALFQEALSKLASRTPVASPMQTKDWVALPAAIRERCLWSAGVTNAKFLQKMQNLLLDYGKKTIVTFPDGKKKLKVGGRADFVKQMMEFVKSEGIPREKQGSIHDIGGSTRLNLIFDTLVKQAESYGYWKQGQDPAILEAFPMQRFIRVVAVKEPRPVHEANIGQVRRKDDLAFWLAMNAVIFGGFGVPWGPWGFNSGCSTEDVGWKEAKNKHGYDPANPPKPPAVGFNEFMEAGLKGVGPDIKAKLGETFKDVAEIQGDKITFTKKGELEELAKIVAPSPPPVAPKPAPVAPPPVAAPVTPQEAPKASGAPSPVKSEPAKPVKPERWSELPEVQLEGKDLHAVVPGWQKNYSDVKYGGLGYGGIIFDDEGRILLREPANHYGGYHWTFAKGGVPKGEDVVKGALREVLEETGHKGQVVGVLEGNYVANGPKSFFFLMKSAGVDALKMDKETAQVRFMTYAEAKAMIEQSTYAHGRKRDLKILDAAFAAHADMMAGKKQAYLATAPALDLSKQVSLPPKKGKAAKPTGFPDTAAGLTYVKELGGSTHAKLYRDNASGREFVVKAGGSSGQAAEEYAANQAYRSAGVRVPETKFMTLDGKPVMVSEFIQGETLDDWWPRASASERAMVAQRMSDNFIYDALFANWDVAGIDNRNIIIDAKGHPWRIDNGGSFRFKAMGGLKGDLWNASVSELQSLRNSAVNAQTARLFAGVTDADIQRGIADALKNKAAILASVPPEIRATLAKRFDTLESMLVKTESRGTLITAEQVKDARLNGRVSLHDRGDIEDLQVLLWEETDASGKPVLKAWLKLTPQGDAKVVENLKKRGPFKVSNDMSAVNAPADTPVSLPSMYFADMLSFAKSYNYHFGKGGPKWNDEKFAIFQSAIKFANNGLANDSISKADHAALMVVADKINKAIASGTAKIETLQEPTWKPKPKQVSKSETKEAAQALSVTVGQYITYKASIKNGLAKRNEDPNLAAGKIKSTALHIKKGEVEIAFATESQTEDMAFKGLMDVTVRGGASDSNISKMLETLKEIGVDVSQPTDAYREYLYIKHVAHLNGKTESAGWLHVEEASTDEERRKRARDYVKREFNFTPPEKPGPGYDWRGKAGPDGSGHIFFERFDLTADEVRKKMSGYYIGIDSSYPLDWFKGVVNGGGQLTPTVQRYRRGVPLNAGMSVSADRKSGGASYIFTRIFNKGRASNIVLDVGLLARTDAVSYPQDLFGDVEKLSYRKTKVGEYIANAGRADNETNLKNGLSIFGPEFKHFTVATKQQADELIDFMRNAGYETWPDGRKLEDVIITQAKWKTL